MALARIRAALGPAGAPTFQTLALPALTANRPVYADADKALQSVTIGTSLSFTAPTLNTIQDIRTTDSPTFAGLTLTGQSGVLKATAGVVAGGGAHADLAGVTADQHHNQAHAIDGADHTASGLTVGHVLTALTPTTFGFAEAAGGVENPLLLAAAAEPVTITLQRCNGTLSEPSRVSANDAIGLLNSSAYWTDTTGYALKESVSTGDTGSTAIYGVYWAGVTFVTTAAYNLIRVGMKMYRAGSPGTVTISIRATSGGLPTGDDLVTTTFDGNTLGTTSPGAFVYVDFPTALSVSNATTYAIIVRALSGNMSNLVYLRLTSTSYSNYKKINSSNSGSSWSSSSGPYLFETYAAVETGDYRNVAQIGGYAEEAHTSTTGASYFRFDTTASGSTTPREVMRLTSAGILRLPVSLTASRLVASDASKGLASVADLSAWVAGTANRVTVTNDGDGTITLSGPQDLATTSAPQFARLGVGTTADVAILLSLLTSDNIFPTFQVRNSSASYRAAWRCLSETNTYLDLRTHGASWTETLFGGAQAGACTLIANPLANAFYIGTYSNYPIIFGVNNAEQARLTATGLGVGVTATEKIHSSAKVRANTCFNVNGTDGVSGSFTTADSKTVTVTGGIITGIA